MILTAINKMDLLDISNMMASYNVDIIIFMVVDVMTALICWLWFFLHLYAN